MYPVAEEKPILTTGTGFAEVPSINNDGAVLSDGIEVSPQSNAWPLLPALDMWPSPFGRPSSFRRQLPQCSTQ
jgi:hypothetical protein